MPGGPDPPTTPIHSSKCTDSPGVVVASEVDGGDDQLKMDWKRVDSSLTPPKAPGGVSLPVSEVERRMIQDGFQELVNGSGCDRNERRIVYYLYGRELGKDLPLQEDRKAKIKRFIADAETIARMNSILPLVAYPRHRDRPPNDDGSTEENRRLWRRVQEMVLRYEARYSSPPRGGSVVDTVCCRRARKKGSSCTTIFRGGQGPVHSVHASLQ
jgi:hypothetical protein